MLPKSVDASVVADNPLKIGVIGTGNRGTGHINTLLTIDGIEITAVCDMVESKAMNADNLCEAAGRKRPAIY